MGRVEKSMACSRNPFSRFEASITLSQQVKQRTEELRQTSARLEAKSVKIEQQNQSLKLAKQEIAQAHEYSRAVINSLTDALVVVGKCGVIKDVNLQAGELFQLTREEIIGKNVNDYLLEFNESIGERLETGEVRFRNSKQQVIPCRLSSSALEKDGEASEEVIFLLRDISQIKAMEAMLEHERAKALSSSKLAALGEMAGGIAHEINNPLTIIAGEMYRLSLHIEKGSLDGDVASSIVSNVDRTIKRITKIVRAMRTVSRDTNEFSPKQNRLSLILEDALGLCTERFKAYGIRLDLEEGLMFGDTLVNCDRVQTSQVLINLLSNAFDAVEDREDKWVRIEFSDENKFHVIKIIDSGKGIDREVREKIFNPFFTSKDIGKGTGLGLTISQNILEKHGGSLDIDDAHANTCFLIKLPKAGIKTLTNVG